MEKNEDPMVYDEMKKTVKLSPILEIQTQIHLALVVDQKYEPIVIKERKFADLIKNNQCDGCVSRAAVGSHCDSLASEYAAAATWLKRKDK